MEDNKNLTPEKPAAAAAAAPKKAAAKKTEEKASRNSVADIKAEFKKVIWPSRSDVKKKTVTVVITSLLMGLIIFCMDSVFTTAYNLVLGLLG